MENKLLDPIAILKSKEEHAREELAGDAPLLALSFPGGIFLYTLTPSAAHQKIVLLSANPGACIFLAGRGKQSDLVILKNEIRQWVNAYEQFVHGKDIAGRIVAPTATAILRRHYLESPKALAVQLVIADPLDPEYPFCSISFAGDQFVAKNFILQDSHIYTVEQQFRSLDEAKAFAKKSLRPRRGLFVQKHAFLTNPKKKVKNSPPPPEPNPPAGEEINQQ